MTDADRDDLNLRDYLMRATHEQLCLFAGALALEVNYRGLAGAEGAFEVSRAIRRCTSTPRAEPLARPRIEGYGCQPLE